MAAIPQRHLNRKHRIADAFDAADLPIVADNLRRCSEVEQLCLCTDCGGTWYVPSKCRSRICPICSYRTALDRAHFLEAMCAHIPHPKFVTLTMRTWTGNPRDGIDFLRDKFTRLRRSKLFRSVAGGAYQIELKSKPDGWHIHLHALLSAPYLPYQQLFSAWRKLIGGYPPQVDIRTADTPKERAYVCKYAAKSADFEGEVQDVVDWYLATKGRRLFGTFGEWYNSKIDDFLSPDEFQPPVVCCPHCGAQGATVRARDGPFVLGREVFADFEKYAIGHLPLERPVQD